MVQGASRATGSRAAVAAAALNAGAAAAAAAADRGSAAAALVHHVTSTAATGSSSGSTTPGSMADGRTPMALALVGGSSRAAGHLQGGVSGRPTALRVYNVGTYARCADPGQPSGSIKTFSCNSFMMNSVFLQHRFGVPAALWTACLVWVEWHAALLYCRDHSWWSASGVDVCPVVAPTRVSCLVLVHPLPYRPS